MFNSGRAAILAVSVSARCGDKTPIGDDACLALLSVDQFCLERPSRRSVSASSALRPSVRFGARRRNTPSRSWPETGCRHRCDQGAVPTAFDDPVSQGQSLHAGKGFARQEALFRYPPFGDLGAGLRELSQPGLRLGRRARGRRRSRHGEIGPALADDHQCRMGLDLHVGRAACQPRGAGAWPDSVSRRNEHADRSADGSACIGP